MIGGMRILSRILLIVGLLLLVVTGVLVVNNVWSIQMIYQVAMANKSQASITDPIPLVLLAVAGAVIAGFITGLGLSMPKGRKKVDPTPAPKNV